LRLRLLLLLIRTVVRIRILILLARIVCVVHWTRVVSILCLLRARG
jgi:hypothetical protein